METSEYKKLLGDVKEYLNSRYDLLRLELLEKLSRILGLVIMALVVVLLVFGALSFFGMALMFLLSKVVPLSVSCCILGAVFLLLIVLAYFCREQWFINPVVKSLAKILFAESDTEMPLTDTIEEVKPNE